MSKFSVAIICQNENNPVFRACLDSALNSFGADEIVIVDGGSIDGTQTVIAKWFSQQVRDSTIKILSRPFSTPQDYTNNRNLAIDNCTGDWILSLDADEVLSDDSCIIKTILEGKNWIEADAWDLKGVHYVYNLNLVDATLPEHVFLSRLFKNMPGNRYPQNSMHGTIPNPDRKILEGTFIHHFGYIKGLVTYMLNKYETESKKWEMHRPQDYENYVRAVLSGAYPVKARAIELPSTLRLNRFQM